jgi:hypothetical protein
MQGAAVAVLTTCLLWTSGVGANAEVVKRWDPEPKCSQRPALDVRWARFNYADDKFVWNVKMGALSRERTRVIARYTVGNRYDVMLATWFNKNGDKRVTGYWTNYRTEEYAVRFKDGVRARWDWKNRLITFKLTSHLKGSTVNAWAYSVAKGELHGPPCGDYIYSGRLDRG